MATLPADILEKTTSLLQQGDTLKNKGLFRDALKPYTAAYALLPDDKGAWDISVSLFNALGQCTFELQEYGAADYFYNQVLFSDEGFVSAEAWIGIGKARFELGDMKKAQEALLSAYMLEGKDAFTEKDAKYFIFLESTTSLT